MFDITDVPGFRCLVFAAIFVGFWLTWLFYGEIKRRAELRALNKVEVINRDHVPIYVNVGNPQKVDVEIVKANSPSSTYDHIERLFGKGTLKIAYFCGWLPEGLGYEHKNGMQDVISTEGLIKGRLGENVDFPRTHIRIPSVALTPLSAEEQETVAEFHKLVLRGLERKSD